MKSLLTIAVVTLLSLKGYTQTNDIHISTGIEWSTNAGVSWAKDLTPADTFEEVVGGPFAPGFTNGTYFFQLKITEQQDTMDTNFTAVTYGILHGTNLLSVTNFMEDAQAIVSPSRVLHTNILYRPWITISNHFTPSMIDCTNCVGNTNPPPHP